VVKVVKAAKDNSKVAQQATRVDTTHNRVVNSLGVTPSNPHRVLRARRITPVTPTAKADK
jgi:hypothetical protein